MFIKIQQFINEKDIRYNRKQPVKIKNVFLYPKKK